MLRPQIGIICSGHVNNSAFVGLVRDPPERRPSLVHFLKYLSRNFQTDTCAASITLTDDLQMASPFSENSLTKTLFIGF